MWQKLAPAISKPLATGSLLLVSASLVACQSPTNLANIEQPAVTPVATDEGSPNRARINELAPDFTGTDSNGVSHTLSNYKGKRGRPRVDQPSVPLCRQALWQRQHASPASRNHGQRGCLAVDYFVCPGPAGSR